MRNFWIKLNYFIRGEAFLHITTMFLIATLFVQIALLFGIFMPTWAVATLTAIVAVLWEVVGKIFEQKPINFGDILWTLVGGFLVILIFRIL